MEHFSVIPGGRDGSDGVGSVDKPSYIVLIEAFHTPTLILNAVVVRERGGGF